MYDQRRLTVIFKAANGPPIAFYIRRRYDGELLMAMTEGGDEKPWGNYDRYIGNLADNHAVDSIIIKKLETSPSWQKPASVIVKSV